jgi:phosphoribosylanthranilate isomerase
MFVKICGITNREDAQAAVDGGARALGFILHPDSPRYVQPHALARWVDDLPPDIWRVGVFVNRPKADVETLCRELRLDVAQLHGSESETDVPQSLRVWKAFRIGHQLPLGLDEYAVEAVLMDGTASGHTFDWKLARNIKQNVILAGGLNEQNVARAIREARPWGVDACSSLEIHPGKKDHARMARFLKACHHLLSNPN